MFYNIKIETSQKNKKGDFREFFEFDNPDLEDVKKHILIPYLKKEEVFIDGRKIQYNQIEQIKIFSSVQTAENLRKRAQSNLSSGIIMIITKAQMLSSSYMEDITKDILFEVRDELQENVKNEIDDAIAKNEAVHSSNKVFIVHGHDNEAKIEVARFIESLGLDAIILHEQSNNGKTIIEKIEQYTDVGYGIVLYTPCDKGAVNNSDDFKARARQNVVFEHGYLIGKLGRNKVAALVKDSVEFPNDISGVVYTLYDKNQGWKLSLGKELRSAGYEIDLNKLMS